MRIERVVLEDHRDVALLRRQLGHVAVADQDPPPVGVSSPAIIRSTVLLPQPDGPDEHQQLAVGDLEIEIARRDVAVRDRSSRRLRGAPIAMRSSLHRAGRESLHDAPLEREHQQRDRRVATIAAARIWPHGT